MKKVCHIVGIAALLLAAGTLRAQAVRSNVGPTAATMPAALQNVGFEPPLDGQMPLDLAFRDETGRSVQLREYFGQKPVVLAFVYYGCPMLCNQVQQGVVGTLRMLSFNPGIDYQVVFVSFDPREKPDMAAEKKKTALAHFRRPGTDSGWHFLTDRKSTRLNSSHGYISYAVFCLKKKKKKHNSFTHYDELTYDPKIIIPVRSP